MDSKYTFYVFILCYVSIKGSNAYLSPEVVKACTEIYDPTMVTTSCCQQINTLAQVNRRCASEGGSSYISSCAEVNCVATIYNITTNGVFDAAKTRAVLVELDNIDQETRSMDMLVNKWCLPNDYTAFPAKDNNCDLWKYLNCAFFSYNIGCPNTRSTGKCAVMKRNIDICRPYADEYVSLLGTFSYLSQQYETSNSGSSPMIMSREQKMHFLSRIFS